MIGHMIFKKNLDTEDKLGIKVIGGQTLPNGRQGALIEKVKRGSIADQEGHIKPGRYSKHTISLFSFSFYSSCAIQTRFLSLFLPFFYVTCVCVSQATK